MIAPDWQPETVDQRIERVIASIPELCPTCGGGGWIETDERDCGVMAVGYEPCPVCFELVTEGEPA